MGAKAGRLSIAMECDAKDCSVKEKIPGFVSGPLASDERAATKGWRTLGSKTFCPQCVTQVKT